MIIGKSIAAFFKDECIYLAASISYFSIVSLVPLSLLIITSYGYFLGQNEALYQFTLSGLVNLFPAVTKGITAELKNIITYKGISLLMLFVYGVLSLQLFYSMEHALNIIFRVPQKRHFLLSIFWSILIVTIVIMLLLISFTASSVVVLAKNYLEYFLGLKTGLKTDILLKYVVPFILVFLTFTVIYVIIPRIRISWGNAFKGAFLVTVMWEAAKYLFTWYVRNVIQSGTIYGSLTTFILFLVWFYYSSCIFLFGAEVVNNLQRKA